MKLEKKISLGVELQKIASASVTSQKTLDGITSGTAATGGALTTPDLNREILSPDFLEGTIYDRCQHVPVAAGFNSIVIPKALQSSRTISSGIVGGLVQNVSAEEGAIAEAIPHFMSDTLVLHKQAILCRVTEEILSDAAYLAKYLHDKFTEAFRFYTDYAILYGNTVSSTTSEGTVAGPTCNGVLNSGNRATYFLTLNATLTLADLRSMVKAYYGSPKGVWAMNQYTFNQIVDLAQADNNYQSLKWMHVDSGSEELVPYLFGYRILRKDNMEVGDIVLGDFSQYSVAEINPRTDVSSEVYYTTYEQAYRMLYRVNGAPNWSGKIQLEDGSNVYSFVACQHANQNPANTNSVSFTSADGISLV